MLDEDLTPEQTKAIQTVADLVKKKSGQPNQTVTSTDIENVLKKPVMEGSFYLRRRIREALNEAATSKKFPWATNDHNVLGFVKTVGGIDDMKAFENACCNILNLKSPNEIDDDLELSDIQAWEIAQMSYINVDKATTSITKEAFGKRLLNTLMKNSDGEVNKDKFMTDYEKICSKNGVGDYLNSKLMTTVASDMNRLGEYENLTEAELTVDSNDWMNLRAELSSIKRKSESLKEHFDRILKDSSKFHEFGIVLNRVKDKLFNFQQEIGEAVLRAEDMVETVKKKESNHLKRISIKVT